MKHLFFAVVAFGLLLGTSQLVNAQANVNLERLSAKNKPAASPKFIDNIEINPLTASTAATEKEVLYAEEISVITAAAKSNTPASLSAIENCSSLQFKYALLMDTEVESISNLPLYDFIDNWWGTRYRYGGRDRSGIDCSAFCGKLMSDIYGISMERTAREQFRQCEKIANEDLKEGDLVFFNTRGGISHVGFYLSNNYFVHSSVHSGVTISSLTDDYYGKKFICGGRPVK
jgi:hypothetical protein